MTPKEKLNAANKAKSELEEALANHINLAIIDFQKKHGIAIGSIYVCDSLVDMYDKKEFRFVDRVSIDLNEKPFLLENLE